MLILVNTPLDESKVSHVVRRNAICDHPLVHLNCLINHVGLNASLDHASVHKDSWLDSLGLHLIEDTQRLIDLPQLLIDLGQNGVSHIARLDLELFHIAVALEGHLKLISLEAAI